MASISILVLIVLLLAVKGGTITYISLAWSGLVMLCSMKLIVSYLDSVLLPKLRTQSILVLLKYFATRPLFWLFSLQCWLILQLLFGISQDQQASIDQSILGVGFLSFLMFLGSVQWRHASIKYFSLGLLVLALVQAIYGLWVFLTQTNMILWMEKLYYLDKPTGTLVNANHFAAYLSMTLILMSAIFVEKELVKGHFKTLRQGLMYLFEQLYSFYALSAILLIITIFATRSIGGIGSLLITFLSSLIVLVLGNVHRKQWMKQLFFSCLFVLVTIVSILLFSDFSILEKEWTSLAFTFERRLEISSAVLRMIADNWFLGVGAGAFYSSFSQYRDLDVGNSFYHFAHNDYLHFWAEYGLIGCVLGLLFIISSLRINYKVLQQSQNVYKRSFAYASFYATVLLGLHSLVDFPLRVPAFALLYLTILCFNVATFKVKASDQIKSDQIKSNQLKNVTTKTLDYID